MTKTYKRTSQYFDSIFPGKVRKIAVNAGLGCPHGGCIYCNNRSFSPTYASQSSGSINAQISQGIKFSESKGNVWGYLPFFQAYTNTYGKIEELKAKYEEALSYPRVAGLVIATRPDCLSPELISWMDSRFGNNAPAGHPYLLMELGIESTEDRTLELINRGHSYSCAVDAVNTLHDHGIAVGAHIILGLPGEKHTDFMNHARRLAELPLSTLKLHQLQIIRGTRLEQLYAQDPSFINLFTPEQYAETVAKFIELSSPNVAFDRFVSEVPKSMLIAPSWGIKPGEFQQMVDRQLLFT